MKNRIKESKEAREAFAFSRLFRSALIGIGIMIAVALLTMLCSSAIAYSMADPAAFTFPFGIASLYISIFAGGIAVSKTGGDSRLLSGLIYTAAAFLLFSAIKLPMMGSESVWGAGIYMLICLAFSALGIVFPIILPKRRKSNHKKRAEKFRRKK